MIPNTRSTPESTVSAERWSRWVLDRRFGGSQVARTQTDDFLAPIRQRVLDMASIQPGDVVLDIASRDGYMGLGALPLVGDTGTVHFTERSAELLDACRISVLALGLAHRATFRTLAPDDLDDITDGAVDVVMMRSILNYVPDKLDALRQYQRVLRPGGRLAFIQMFPSAHRTGELIGYRVPSVEDLAARVRAVLRAHRPSTYQDFDDRQLLSWVEQAGFATIDLHHEIEIRDRSDWPPPNWDEAKLIAAGPDQPTLAEAIEEALTPAEADRLIAVLRPEVEAGRRAVRFPKSFVRAVRSGEHGERNGVEPW